MAAVNKVILVGNVGRDPELRYTQSGQAVANFSLATTERFQNKSGEREERTEWHRIVAWGRTAELCAQYLSKGRSAYIEGGLRTREWEDRDGQKRRTTEVHALNVQFLGAPRGDSGAPRGDSGAPRGDSGAPRGDSGTPHGDSGTPHGDAGPPRGDAGGRSEPPPGDDEIPF